MIINHNMNAMNAHRNMGSTTVSQGKSMEKLSSGLRINRAGDDAAGLAISEKMRSQIRGLNQASRNAQDGISMIQTAEGALSETQAIGQRMRELAVQSANGTYTDEDRELINQEFTQLKSEIDRIATDTDFSGSKVLNGEKSGEKIEFESGTVTKTGTGTFGNAEAALVFLETDLENVNTLGEGTFKLNLSLDGDDVKLELIDESKFNDNKAYVLDSTVIKDGAADNDEHEITLGGAAFKLAQLKDKIKDANVETVELTLNNVVKEKTNGVELQVGANKDQMISISIGNMRSRELGLGGVNVATTDDAKDAIGRLDEAVSRISAQRADLGASQNRLEHTIASTDNTAENLQAAESRIRDVDMAKEMMNLTKLNVLQQASQAMLAQANQAPQQVLSLLK
ncbi:flagellin [Candidatus Arthromitus sp. SFB-mouse]|uniref:flagellin N-terminal helical domain-containing protein n=1 Tax=Candidatus Arthromitus sp. SFB-mouse TaxID=49118 RepID=UPI000229684E|nr:flagellin [Candidatus Arthromitus sp. SFB-mouse]EGX28961.1 flagellin [Candidatus Arthromitus sp. SFB-mouse-NYU]BAK79688.1 flagellin protein FliB(S) [Candidatus Arthromitus sp. SFB-mouse-Yit]